MKTNDIKIGHAPKTVELADGTVLHFWYANNAGRGKNNCTIIHSTSELRDNVSKNQTGVIAVATTSAWAGKVNFSKSVQAKLNL